MKKLTVVLLALIISACASPIVKRPAADTVKKIAFISVYSNSSIYNVKNPDQVDTLAILKKAVKGNDNIQDGNVQLSTFALKHYSENLSTAQWQVVPAPEVISHPAYKTFTQELKGEGAMGFLNKMAGTKWAVPPEMAHFPFEVVAKTNQKTYTNVNGKMVDAKTVSRERLAKLSQELGVDAVGIIHVDLAFEKGMLDVELPLKRAKAMPKVSSEMVVINSKGEIAMQTGRIVRGKGKRFEASEKAPMIQGGRVEFAGKDGQETIKAFSEAIEKSAHGLKSEIEKELGKKS
ncbi:MAG: hypothetical protein OEY38_13350 [Gammaproteobacteria bacterium]|nr:hypothetical protein [Gammaproteobacteria bacterium]